MMFQIKFRILKIVKIVKIENKYIVVTNYHKLKKRLTNIIIIRKKK